MSFNIGEEVRDEISNEIGVIKDKMFSQARKMFIYAIESHNDSRLFMRDGSTLELYKKAKEYKVETEIADNVVIGIIYEINGDLKTEVCRGHGHIIHEGAEGVAQACAYAYKQAFTAIDSGIYLKQKRKQGRNEHR